MLTSDAPKTSPSFFPAWEKTTLEAERLGASGALLSSLGSLLGRLGAHSPETLEHSLRVGAHVQFLLGGTNTELLGLLGGTMHDVGKLKVPQGVLQARPFGQQERLRMRIHPQAGFDLLVPYDQEIACIAGLHHMFQPDAYGVLVRTVFPEFPPEFFSQVEETAEVVSLCDFFDALTTRSDEVMVVEDPTDPLQVEVALRQRFARLGDMVPALVQRGFVS